MASHKSVLHTQRGFRMSESYAKQVMREHCTITWEIPGKTIRDTTNEERIAMRSAQEREAVESEPLSAYEVPGLKFLSPPTTYRRPTSAYDNMDIPISGHRCRWPRLEGATA